MKILVTKKCGIGRPVLIVSADNINRKSGNVIVVTLSKNIKWEDPITKRKLKYDTHYVLKKVSIHSWLLILQFNAKILEL